MRRLRERPVSAVRSRGPRTVLGRDRGRRLGQRRRVGRDPRHLRRVRCDSAAAPRSRRPAPGCGRTRAPAGVPRVVLARGRRIDVWCRHVRGHHLDLLVAGPQHGPQPLDDDVAPLCPRGELITARSGQGRFERIRAAISSSSLVDIWRKPLVLAISARSCWSWYGTPGGSGARCQCTCALPLLLPRLRM
jgi:hypothetical protein